MTSRSPREISNALLLSEYRRRGNRSARDRVIEQNLPLVRAIARRFARSPEQLDDLVQVGSIGLIKAVEGYEERRGRNLAAYAIPTIVGELRRSVGDPSWPVRRPRGTARRPVVVPLDDETLDGSRPPSDLEQTEQRLLLYPGIRSLSPRERRVIVLRYYEDRSQEQIAVHLGISQPQVSRILARALGRLRDELVPPEETLCASSHVTTMSAR